MVENKVDVLLDKQHLCGVFCHNGVSMSSVSVPPVSLFVHSDKEILKPELQTGSLIALMTRTGRTRKIQKSKVLALL